MKSLTTKLYTYKFFDDFVLIYPFYAVMFADSGLSASQISMLLLAWSITSFVLEIPSGVLADRFSRRDLLIVGQAIRILGYIFWIFKQNFFGFLIGFIFWGIKSAFTSGTLEAYTYDALKTFKKEKLYQKVYGRIKSLAFVAILFASILASPLVEFGYNFLLIISLVSLSASTIALILCRDYKSYESTHEKEYLKILKDGVKLVLRTKALLLIILFISILAGFMAFDEYLPLFSENAGLDKTLIGIYMGVYSLIQALFAVYAHRISKLSKTLLSFLLALSGFLLLLGGIFTNMFSLFLIMLIGGISTYIAIISEDILQKHSKSSVRATVSSVKGFTTEIVAFGVYGLFGIVGMFGSLNVSIIILGSIISFLGLLFLTLFKLSRLKTKHRH